MHPSSLPKIILKLCVGLMTGGVRGGEARMKNKMGELEEIKEERQPSGMNPLSVKTNRG